MILKIAKKIAKNRNVKITAGAYHRHNELFI